MPKRKDTTIDDIAEILQAMQAHNDEQFKRLENKFDSKLDNKIDGVRNGRRICKHSK